MATSTKKKAKKTASKAKAKELESRPLLKKEAILKEAHLIVLNEGHEALSLRYLAAQLDVTAAALYAHVDNKLDLMRHLAEAEYNRRADKYEAIATNDPFERLREICHTYVNESQKEPNIFRFLLLFPPIGAWDSPQDTLPAGNRAFKIASSAVEDGIEEGLLKDDDAFMMSIAVWTAVHGVASFIIQGASFVTEMSDEIVDNVVGAVLSGLASGPEARRRIEHVFSKQLSQKSQRKLQSGPKKPRKRKRV